MKVGSDLSEGDIVGTITTSRNPNSIVAPHLHLSMGIIADEETANTTANVNFDVIDKWAQEDRVIKYFNVLRVIPIQVRRTLFLEGNETNLGIQSVNIV